MEQLLCMSAAGQALCFADTACRSCLLEGNICFPCWESSAKPTAFVLHREQNLAAPPAHSRMLGQRHPPAQPSALHTSVLHPCRAFCWLLGLQTQCTARSCVALQGRSRRCPRAPTWAGFGEGFCFIRCQAGEQPQGPQRSWGGGVSPTTPSPTMGLGYCASAERNAIRAAGREASKG